MITFSSCVLEVGFTVPGWFSWFQVGFHGFYGSRLVFHGSRSVFMVFHGSRSGFMIFQGSRSFFMVSGRFLWLFKVQG